MLHARDLYTYRIIENRCRRRSNTAVACGCGRDRDAVADSAVGTARPRDARDTSTGNFMPKSDCFTQYYKSTWRRSFLSRHRLV
ncbi:hypothetical protein THIOKS12140005 [Thiocapsa sp. KS1]|nr:hypothetical protein THIOKS12140005 [Thiocapsa sp. KS1]